MLNISKEIIRERKNTLENCRKILKNEFVGIDAIIDDLLNYIQVWYLMPEILVRPVIVNLWGMTGVGKTDLVRKMVKALHFQDRFAEVELSNTDETSWEKSVSSILENYDFHDAQPAIVLFDEIQRFNTIDSEGNPLQQSKFVDFWELLSDGKLSKKSRSDIDYYLFNYVNRKKEAQRKKDKGEAEEEEIPLVGLYEAQSLKKALGIETDVMELMDMPESEMIDIILSAKKKKAIYEPIDHSKTLILISGNLDEAFTMALQTGEADVDADIFHSFTKKITVVDIKNALSRKFRPEQVARFGNIHLIYNSLRKKDFERLISKEVARIIQQTEEKLSIKLSIDSSIHELIYRNGVFPVQGVRPVFSSITDIVDANLSNLLFEAVMKDVKTIKISYDYDKEQIKAQIGKKISFIPYIGRIDKIRESNLEDNTAAISVHEAGHAVIYMLSFGLAPLQLKSKIASSYSAGFTFPHQIYQTKDNILHKIRIYLAGGIAEEIVFGTNHASTGRSNDREEATVLAIDFVRKYAFGENSDAVYNLDTYSYRMNQYVTDAQIELLISNLASETKQLLLSNRILLVELSQELCSKGSMTANEIAELGEKFGIYTHVREEGYLHIEKYKDTLDKL